MMPAPPLTAEHSHRRRPTIPRRAPAVRVSVALAALPAIVVALVSYPAVTLGVLLGSFFATTMTTVRSA